MAITSMTREEMLEEIESREDLDEVNSQDSPLYLNGTLYKIVYNFDDRIFIGATIWPLSYEMDRH